MKLFLIVLLIFAVFIFTGTWIFGSMSWFFNLLSTGCEFLEKTFNMFGWNQGMLV